MRDDRGELWFPDPDSRELDLSDPLNLNQAILNVAKLSDEDVARVVGHLADAGQYYQAGRCLEVVAQERLGLEAPAHAVNPSSTGFGAFHAAIYILLRAGALYSRSRRPRTADTVFRRALIFVEESLRSVDSLRTSHIQDLWSVGVTFELAGHVCVALADRNGIDYYQAARDYWDQAIRLRPEEIPALTVHPVTRTVISCLESAIEARKIDDNYRGILFSSDYATRIDTATSLLR